MTTTTGWPALVDPLASICHEAESEQNIPAGTMALAMVAAGWTVAAQEYGPATAAVALLAALDTLRDQYPHQVAAAESAQRVGRQRDLQ